MQANLTRYEEMMSFLPWYYQDSKIMQGIMHGDAEEIEAIRADIEFIFSQFYIDTATESGVALWEKELGITPISGATLELRKAQIKAKLQRPAIMTPKQIQSIANLFTKSGGAVVTEVPGSYHFHIKIPFGDLLWPAEMKEAIREAKPAHLGFDVALKWGRLFLLNSSGGVERVEIPGKSWIEKRPYIVFDTGLNASGAIEKISRTQTTRQQHSSYIFKSGTTNGRLRLNNAGEFSREEKDLGGNVTERWNVFCGSRLNSRASPTLNDSPTREQSKTYHKAEWKEVINRHGNALNAAGGGTRKNWTTETTTSRTEKRFTRPGYALNRMGSITTAWRDVGHDVQLKDVLFGGCTLNGGKPMQAQRQHEETSTKSWTIFSGSRLNARERPVTNRSNPQQQYSTVTRCWTESVATFGGCTLNGGMRTNSGKPESVARIVHVPVWREVVTRHGGTILNASKHSIKTLEIPHSTPGRTEKRFRPERGTLLNGKAVMGYFTI